MEHGTYMVVQQAEISMEVLKIRAALPEAGQDIPDPLEALCSMDYVRR